MGLMRVQKAIQTKTEIGNVKVHSNDIVCTLGMRMTHKAEESRILWKASQRWVTPDVSTCFVKKSITRSVTQAGSTERLSLFTDLGSRLSCGKGSHNCCEQNGSIDDSGNVPTSIPNFLFFKHSNKTSSVRVIRRRKVFNEQLGPLQPDQWPGIFI